MACPHFPRVSVVSRPLVFQVVWGRAVGSQHAGRAAVPGPVQRAGAQVRHGRRLPGPARELRRQNVSARVWLRWDREEDRSCIVVIT